ncbi:MAG: hypothetical protein NE334_00715 [Lentisphaeraceae bacterium]|nr:hypothetical protein [Lentisphaeraceae bacterium]
MIPTLCPHYGWSDKVQYEYLGQVAECPQCEADFQVELVEAEETVKSTPKLTVKKRSKGIKQTRSVPKRRPRKRVREEEVVEEPPETPSLFSYVMKRQGFLLWGPVLFTILAYIAALDAANGVGYSTSGRRAGLKVLFYKIGEALGTGGSLVLGTLMFFCGFSLYFVIAKLRIRSHKKRYGLA